MKKLKKEIKTLLWEYATNKNAEKEQLKITYTKIEVRISLISIVIDLFIIKSIKQKLTLLPVLLILTFADYNL